MKSQKKKDLARSRTQTFSSLKSKIIDTSARIEALSQSFEKTKVDFYKITASISGSKGDLKVATQTKKS